MEQDYDGAFLLYSSLKPIFTLNILGYPHFVGDDDALRIFTLYDRKRNKSFDELSRKRRHAPIWFIWTFTVRIIPPYFKRNRK